ncbi:MAG TPA: hypothetical protein VHZ03_23590 [Trebonia sp.]|nr:hypothetical protein [Trebonia sp.]
MVFIENVVNDADRTRRLTGLVLSAAVAVSLTIAATAIPLLAFRSSNAIGIGALCGSLTSMVAVVTTVARIVKGFRRRKSRGRSDPRSRPAGGAVVTSERDPAGAAAAGTRPGSPRRRSPKRHDPERSS